MIDIFVIFGHLDIPKIAENIVVAQDITKSVNDTGSLQ